MRLDLAALRGECLVQLRWAPLPPPLRALARHYWFTVLDPEHAPDQRCWHRWEVWQWQGAGGVNWGHVHPDLMDPTAGVGGGPSRMEVQWRGAAAGRLARVLNDPLGYPYRSRYRAWPGPNSNTYAAWVLHRAGVEHALDRHALGKDYLGRWFRAAVIFDLAVTRLHRTRQPRASLLPGRFPRPRQ